MNESPVVLTFICFYRSRPLTTCQKRDLCQKSMIYFNQSESSKIDGNYPDKLHAPDQSEELSKQQLSNFIVHYPNTLIKVSSGEAILVTFQNVFVRISIPFHCFVCGGVLNFASTLWIF